VKLHKVKLFKGCSINALLPFI